MPAPSWPNHDTKRRAEQPWRRWYSTRRWQARRHHQLTAEPLCRLCQAQGLITAANTADHVIPHRGNPDLFWSGDLQSLCAPCHSSAKQAEELTGYSKAIGIDGFPIDPRHPANG